MGRLRHARARLAAAAAVCACVAAIAGCGGGGDGGSSSIRTGVSLPTPTAPTQRGSGAARGSTSTNPVPTVPGSGTTPDIHRVQQALGPFRACLTSHGVQPIPFGSQPQRQQLAPDELKKQIQARIACIPELPPKLRKAAEQLKQRYEQRTAR